MNATLCALSYIGSAAGTGAFRAGPPRPKRDWRPDCCVWARRGGPVREEGVERLWSLRAERPRAQERPL
jgi:hypothetical protein